MKTKHVFVPALDVGEILPFVAKKKKSLKENLKEQERSKKELEKFINKLEKNFKENIWYMGFDVIAEKSYERFIFNKNGFFEVMTEAPAAMVAHFLNTKRANKFCEALKKTLKQMMPKSYVSKNFIDSIKPEVEQSEVLTVNKWTTMKKIRGL
jgi:hypothetical protein